MIKQLNSNWRIYLKEAFALGIFMTMACGVTILLEHPSFGVPVIIKSSIQRRFLAALTMGFTAIVLIYSKWGIESGAHMNPAVTLANYQLSKIHWNDAFWYIIAQFSGAIIAVWLINLIAHSYLDNPSVNYLATLPGTKGVFIAFIAEILLAFILFLVILIVSNSKWAKYTGYFAGLLVFLFILVEAPLSGMSINPARSFGSALIGNIWKGIWIYFIAPVSGMQMAAYIYRRWYFAKNNECSSMNVFMSGCNENNRIYKVLHWYEKNNSGKIIKQSITE